LEPGSYSLSVEHPGFRRELVSNLILETGQSARIDVTLKVGAVTDSVEVQASAPLLNAALLNRLLDH